MKTQETQSKGSFLGKWNKPAQTIIMKDTN